MPSLTGTLGQKPTRRGQCGNTMLVFGAGVFATRPISSSLQPILFAARIPRSSAQYGVEATGRVEYDAHADSCDSAATSQTKVGPLAKAFFEVLIMAPKLISAKATMVSDTDTFRVST